MVASLLERARARGVTTLHADVLSDDKFILRGLRRIGPLTASLELGTISVDVDLGGAHRRPSDMKPALARTIWRHVEADQRRRLLLAGVRRGSGSAGAEGLLDGLFRLSCRAPWSGGVRGRGGHVLQLPSRPGPTRHPRCAGAMPARVRFSPSAAPRPRPACAGSSPSPMPNGWRHSALPLLRDVVGNASPFGRPLFAANRDVDAPPDPVAALWQAATTLREHRGDGHVAPAHLARTSRDVKHTRSFAACANIPPERSGRVGDGLPTTGRPPSIASGLAVFWRATAPRPHRKRAPRADRDLEPTSWP